MSSLPLKGQKLSLRSKKTHISDCEARFRNYLPLDTSIFLQNCQQDSNHVRIQETILFFGLSRAHTKNLFFNSFWIFSARPNKVCCGAEHLCHWHYFFVYYDLGTTTKNLLPPGGQNPVTSPSPNTFFSWLINNYDFASLKTNHFHWQRGLNRIWNIDNSKS